MEIFYNIKRKDKLFYIVLRIIDILINFSNIKRPNVK